MFVASNLFFKKEALQDCKSTKLIDCQEQWSNDKCDQAYNYHEYNEILNFVYLGHQIAKVTWQSDDKPSSEWWYHEGNDLQGSESSSVSKS